MAKDTFKYLLFAIGFLLFSVLIYKYSPQRPSSTSSGTLPGRNGLEIAYNNYAEEVFEYAEKKGVSYEYLMALIVLECSGKKPAGTRYEKHVFQRLVDLRSGERRKLENLRRRDVRNAGDAALKNLATSWGPFQIMGYKCIGLGVKVKDIRGDDAVKHGIIWIEKDYGKLLSKNKYKDAFHFHNTGRKFPRNGVSRTHDPQYVNKGLRYMEYFKSHKPE